MPDPAALFERLARFPIALKSAVEIANPADVRWKPTPKDWSILEIACHLLDEEKEDFRPRIRLTLDSPETPWPKLDLEGVAEKRAYGERDLAKVIDEFGDERAKSIEWLRALGAVDWTKSHVHPKVGPIAAGDLLGAWAAHDAYHLRQIAKRLYNLASRDGGPHTAPYAGEWTA